MIKYFWLMTLSQIYFMFKSVNNWMNVFNKSQQYQLYYDLNIRKLTIAYMIALCSIHYFIVKTPYGRKDKIDYLKAYIQKEDISEQIKLDGKISYESNQFALITSLLDELEKFMNTKYHKRISSIDIIKMRQYLKAD